MPTTDYIRKPFPSRNTKNLCNQIFDRLHVLGYVGTAANGTTGQTVAVWLCQCTCGTLKEIKGCDLTRGKVRSCGCLLVEASKASIHGDAHAVEYAAYHGAKARCETVTDKSYKDYGWRGIEFRFTSYAEFLEHIGRKPSPDHSLDRIDVNGHYEVGNLRWATRTEQQRNRQQHTWITAFGQTKILAQWAEEYAIGRTRIQTRINKHKWCAECAITIPPLGGTCPHKT